MKNKYFNEIQKYFLFLYSTYLPTYFNSNHAGSSFAATLEKILMDYSEFKDNVINCY